MKKVILTYECEFKDDVADEMATESALEMVSQDGNWPEDKDIKIVNDTDILPCPFCGEPAMEFSWNNSYGFRFCIECENEDCLADCAIIIEGKNKDDKEIKEKVRKLWNTRSKYEH